MFQLQQTQMEVIVARKKNKTEVRSVNTGRDNKRKIMEGGQKPQRPAVHDISSGKKHKSKGKSSKRKK